MPIALAPQVHPTLVLCELRFPPFDGVLSLSPFCTKAAMALNAVALPYESRRGAMPATFKALNPTGQVPVLVVDGVPIADSSAIVAKIDALSGHGFTRSLSPTQRAEALLWEEFADTSVNGFLVAARWADDSNWRRTRDAYFGAIPFGIRHVVRARLRQQVVRSLVARDVWRAGPAACWERFSALLDQLEARAPAEGFWISPTLSLADISLCAQLGSLRTPLTPLQHQELSRRKQLSAYLDRVQAARADTQVLIARSA